MVIKGEGKNRIYSGRVIKDAEYRIAGSKGTPLTTFAVSFDRDATDGGIINVTCFNKLAESGKGIKKGDAVLVAGSLDSSEYNGKTYWKLIADYISCTGVPAAAPAQPEAWSELKTEDIPF